MTTDTKTDAPLLDVRSLTIDLPRGADRPHAVEDLTFTLDRGEILCVVGESGSGKSMTAHAVMGLLPKAVKVSSGGIRHQGTDVLSLPERDQRALRGGRIAMIFQEPMTALNPLMRVGDQIDEVLRYHTTLNRAARGWWSFSPPSACRSPTSCAAAIHFVCPEDNASA